MAAMASLLLAVVVGFFPASAQAKRTQASIVVHVNSGEVLHACKANETVFPASLTKVMTLYLTFEALEQGKLTLDQELTVSKAAARQPRVNLALKAGDTISVGQAILALVTYSANDVATVIAEAIGGTEEQFAALMTRRAQDLGMDGTLFRNASGLPNREQVSTPRDLARLAESVWRQFPRQYAYFATKEFSYNGKDFETHNRLLARYDGADGLKTGYTRASGFNLVSSAQRDGNRLIGVVVGGDSAALRDDYMERILDYGFDSLAGDGTTAVAPSCKIN